MRNYIGLTVCACVLALMADGRVDAAGNGILTLNSGYKAGPPPSALPSGFYNVPAGTYRVVVDYGNIVNGTYTADPNIAPSYISTTTISAAGGQYNYGPAAVQNLQNLTANSYARAQLQQLDPNTLLWNTIATAYSPLF